MAKTIINVNRHHIAANKKDGGNRPVFSVKSGGKTRYALQIDIEGPSSFIYDKDDPLDCGATVWVETHSPVTLYGEMSYQDAKNSTDRQAERTPDHSGPDRHTAE